MSIIIRKKQYKVVVDEKVVKVRTLGTKGVPGPKGDQGDQGIEGEQGIQGIQGELGPVGPQGDQGIQGESGETGAKGDTGDIGPEGPQGIQGVKGDQGEQGVIGPQGPEGEQGPQGEQGIQGVPGPQGVEGPQGPDGVGEMGAQGPQGEQGDPGPEGPQGIAGPQGVKGDTGDLGPTGPQGEDGPQGVQGETGPAGADGEDGAVGPQGPAGDDGSDGAPGPQGIPGPEGPMGPEGPAGEDGAVGPAGPAGADSVVPGPEGPEGPQGPPGEDGAPGADAPGSLTPIEEETYDHTTALLTAGSTENVTIPYQGMRFIRLQSNYPTRVRIYPSAAMRTADVARAFGEKPVGNHGVLLDIQTSAAWSDIFLAPAADASSLDDNLYMSVKNVDVLSRAVHVTLTYLPTDGARGEQGEPGPQGIPGTVEFANAWSSAVAYEQDEIVTYGGTAAYVAAKDVPAGQPNPLVQTNPTVTTQGEALSNSGVSTPTANHHRQAFVTNADRVITSVDIGQLSTSALSLTIRKQSDLEIVSSTTVASTTATTSGMRNVAFAQPFVLPAGAYFLDIQDTASGTTVVQTAAYTSLAAATGVISIPDVYKTGPDYPAANATVSKLPIRLNGYAGELYWRKFVVGNVGATGAQGERGMLWRQTPWNTTDAYAVNEAVYHEASGASYRAVLPVGANEPSPYAQLNPGGTPSMIASTAASYGIQAPARYHRQPFTAVQGFTLNSIEWYGGSASGTKNSIMRIRKQSDDTIVATATILCDTSSILRTHTFAGENIPAGNYYLDWESGDVNTMNIAIASPHTDFGAITTAVGTYDSVYPPVANASYRMWVRINGIVTTAKWEVLAKRGATGPRGDYIWRGQYNGANTYLENDLVGYNGSVYRANKAITVAPGAINPLVGSSSVVDFGTAAATITIPKPAGLAIGDLIVVSFMTRSAGDAALGLAGFTQRAAGAGSGTIGSSLKIFTKVAASGDVAGAGWTFARTAGAVTLAACRAYRGVTAETPIDVQSVNSGADVSPPFSRPQSTVMGPYDIAMTAFAMGNTNNAASTTLAPADATATSIQSSPGADRLVVMETIDNTGFSTTSPSTPTVSPPQASTRAVATLVFAANKTDIFNAADWDKWVESGAKGDTGAQGPVFTAHAATITGTVSMPGEASPGALAKIACNTVQVDTAGWWNATTMRYVPQAAGRYMVAAFFDGTQVGQSGGFWDLAIMKNGGAGKIHNRLPAATSYGPNITCAGMFIMNGTTDYIELWGGQSPNVAITGSERLDIVYMGPL